MGYIFQLPFTNSYLNIQQRWGTHFILKYVDTAGFLHYPFPVEDIPEQPPAKKGWKPAMKNNIRVERAIKNITQADLAELIGVSRQTINTIESNRYVPSTVLALKIARVFGKPVEEIFMLDETD